MFTSGLLHMKVQPWVVKKDKNLTHSNKAQKGDQDGEQNKKKKYSTFIISFTWKLKRVDKCNT